MLVDRETPGAFEYQLDPLRVSPRRNHEVVFQLPLVAVARRHLGLDCGIGLAPFTSWVLRNLRFFVVGHLNAYGRGALHTEVALKRTYDAMPSPRRWSLTRRVRPSRMTVTHPN